MSRVLACALATLAVSCAGAARPTGGAPSVASAVPTFAAAPSPDPAPSSSVTLPPNASCDPLRDLGDLVAVDATPPVPPIVDPTNDAMSRFYEKLARLVRRRATDHVRVAMYGDSNMTMDYLSGEVRRVFQRRFGDGGHGFVTAAKHLFYRHMDVEHGASEGGWNVFTISNNPVPDRMYGFGLVAVQSRGRGATSFIATADDKSPIGRTASRFDFFFLRRPGGGSFDVTIDGEKKKTIDTSAPEIAAGYERIEVADGPHKAIVETTTAAPARLFGIAMERAAPSVVVDSFGVTSLDLEQLATKNDPAMLTATLAHRPYDLVIVMTGTNEWYESTKHRELVRAFVERQRAANPNVAILLLSPPDKAMGKDATRSAFSIVQMAKEKRDAALANKLAFWDFREAMGGDGAIFEFMRLKMAGSDQRHLTERGGFYMGDRIAYALWRDFGAWIAKHGAAGCAILGG